MVGLIVYESELRKIEGCSYRWNPNGFVLLEYDERGSHFRLDLGQQEGGRRVYSGGDYKFSVNSIHLKDQLYVSQEKDATYWLYYYVAYEGAGVWNWSRDYVKEESNTSRQFRTHRTEAEDSDNGHRAITFLLSELGRVTNTTQGLGIAH